MSGDICGSTDTKTGDPCQNPAGFGTNSDIGPCHLHPARGRPSKFTTNRKQDILEAAERGTTVEGCARAAGITHTTLYDWINKYPDFSDAFNRARAKGEKRLVEEVSIDDPKFILERSFDYTKTERREVDLNADVTQRLRDGFEFEFPEETP